MRNPRVYPLPGDWFRCAQCSRLEEMPHEAARIGTLCLRCWRQLTPRQRGEDRMRPYTGAPLPPGPPGKP